jgi:hypothetical protein
MRAFWGDENVRCAEGGGNDSPNMATAEQAAAVNHAYFKQGDRELYGLDAELAIKVK